MDYNFVHTITRSLPSVGRFVIVTVFDKDARDAFSLAFESDARRDTNDDFQSLILIVIK